MSWDLTKVYCECLLFLLKRLISVPTTKLCLKIFENKIQCFTANLIEPVQYTPLNRITLGQA